MAACATDEAWVPSGLTSEPTWWSITPERRLVVLTTPTPGMTLDEISDIEYSELCRNISGHPSQVDSAVSAVIGRGAPFPLLLTTAVRGSSSQPSCYLTSLKPVFEGRSVVSVDACTRDVTHQDSIVSRRGGGLHEVLTLSYLVAQVEGAGNSIEMIENVTAAMLDVLGGCSARVTLDETAVVCIPAETSSSPESSYSIITRRISADSTLALNLSPEYAARLERTNVLQGTTQLLTLILKKQASMPAENVRDYVLQQVIGTLTEGRLRLISPCELAEARPGQGGTPPVPLTSSLQIRDVRRHIGDLVAHSEAPREVVDDMTCCAIEAATNAVVHAHGGQVSLYAFPARLEVWVCDEGGGLDLSILLRSVLLRSYSSTLSMGLGLGIMLELCDQVEICTTARGTTVRLVKTWA